MCDCLSLTVQDPFRSLREPKALLVLPRRNPALRGTYALSKKLNGNYIYIRPQRAPVQVSDCPSPLLHSCPIAALPTGVGSSRPGLGKAEQYTTEQRTRQFIMLHALVLWLGP